MRLTNRQWIFASRPIGEPTLNNFRFAESAIPTPRENEVLVKACYVSVDPYMRPRMKMIRSYVPSFEVGQVLDANVVGLVVESRHADYSPGDAVLGRMSWADYSVINAQALRKLPTDPNLLSAWLGVLGMTGLSAYFAILDIGRPQPGETVVISAAAGAVGYVAGQIAKIKGARAVGITSSESKIRFLRDECGFDAAINYKDTPNIRKELKEYCPKGIDVYLDNVGGLISDAATTLIAQKARIIICGQISLYNLDTVPMGPRLLSYILVNRARIEGFLVHDYQARFDEGIANLTQWLKEGKISRRETVVEGLENAPRAFLGLFHGDNIGKQLVKVS